MGNQLLKGSSKQHDPETFLLKYFPQLGFIKLLRNYSTKDILRKFR
jgi:hypothetical protein